MCDFLFPINCHDKHISLIIPRIMGMPFSSARAQLLDGKTLRPSSEPLPTGTPTVSRPMFRKLPRSLDYEGLVDVLANLT